MPPAIEQRLAELGLELPAPAQPVANFVAWVHTGTLLYVSGQIPVWNGQLRYVGKVGREISLDEARAAARLCGLNVLAQVRSYFGGLERVVRVCQLQVFVNATPEFPEHPAVANGASDLMVEVFGPAAGKHARFAVGAGSLPFNVAVELAAVLEVS
jgi:enamine deaminase RidA (YjgF/YER057c/UK114 family)